MGWTTIRVKEDTKDELREKIDAENMDERVQYLLGNIESYIDEEIRNQLKRLHINDRGNIELR